MSVRKMWFLKECLLAIIICAAIMIASMIAVCLAAAGAHLTGMSMAEFVVASVILCTLGCAVRLIWSGIK